MSVRVLGAGRASVQSKSRQFLVCGVDRAKRRLENRYKVHLMRSLGSEGRKDNRCP